MPVVTVVAGDCIASIAAEHGHLAATLWEHGDNAALKALRLDPMVLHPGDQVFIPERETKTVDAAAGQSHRYVCKAAAPTFLNLRFLDFLGEARANAGYVIEIDGELRETRSTDGDGWLREPIPARAARARVLFTPEEPGGDPGTPPAEAEWIAIDLGQLDPIETLTGVQQRLRNLDFTTRLPTGALDAPTVRALKRLQKHCGLPRNGELDGATRARLLELHGC